MEILLPSEKTQLWGRRMFALLNRFSSYLHHFNAVIRIGPFLIKRL